MLIKDGRFTAFLVLQLCVALGIVAAILFWPGKWDGARWMGVLIAAPATFLLFLARLQLGKSFSLTPQARELVTQGVYSRIRNPIYVFGWFLVLGFVLALHWRTGFILLAAMVPLQIVRAHKESKVLEEKFGDAYREYKKKTWF